MKNLDKLEKETQQLYAQLYDAVTGEDQEAFAKAFANYAEGLQKQVLEEARQLAHVNDMAILAQRGVRQLTSEETEYYQKLIDGMRSNNPKQALTDVAKVLPKTTIDAVFENITEAHPLLNHIDFQNTDALIEILISKTSGVAVWGDLCADITAEVGATFDVIDLVLKKLAAYIPVCNAMLDLGPVWLDRYVRLILSETVAVGVEDAAVDGDGDQKPIGMTRQLTGAVDGVYPRKATVTVNDLSPATIGGILAAVSQGPNGKQRAVPRLLMVVGPADYYSKVFAASTVRATDGTFNSNVFPYPMDVVISPAVPAGHAVFGLASQYFFGLGTAKGGKLEYSDDVKFLEDARVYRIKLYGNGQPKDENAFVYADISGMTPAYMQVEVVSLEDMPVA